MQFLDPPHREGQYGYVKHNTSDSELVDPTWATQTLKGHFAILRAGHGTTDEDPTDGFGDVPRHANPDEQPCYELEALRTEYAVIHEKP